VNVSPNTIVFPVDSKPYGKSYAEWSAIWWQWLLSIPNDTSPAGDSTGKSCATNQQGPIWFLAGTFGGAAERTCTIPSGKTIMFSSINSECSYAEYPDEKTESDLLECAKTFQDQTTYALCTGYNKWNCNRKSVYNLHHSMSHFQKIMFLEYHLARHKPYPMAFELY
jgi:hypothetical protein